MPRNYEDILNQGFSIKNISHQQVPQLICTSEVCLFSFVQTPSLPSSYDISSSWILSLSEQASSALFFCVCPHLRDFWCIFFSSCTFCPCHRFSIMVRDIPWPGNHVCPVCFPQLQDMLQLWQEAKGSCGAVHDMSYKPIPASTTTLSSPNNVWVFVFLFSFSVLSTH